MKSREWIVSILTLAVCTMTLATASVAFGRNIIPGTTLPGGEVYTGGGGPPGPSTEPDDPFSKPRTPGPLGLIEPTDSSLRFQWTDNSSYEQGYELYRGSSYQGPWTLIASWGPTPGATGTMEYTDYGLSRDTRYYYKVRAYNFYGESSAIQTFATIDGRLAVSRLQVRLRTANVSDANTDDDVHVSVNDYNTNYGTWLDYGRNDFERGDEFTYELIPEGVTDLSDINDIYIFKTGSDGWCIESLALLVNGGVIYTQEFGSTSSTCRWLDNSGDSQNHYVVGRAMLRAHPLWQNFQSPVPALTLFREDIESRVEGIVGDILHDDVYVDAFPIYTGDVDPYWGYLYNDRYVEVSKKDGQAVHVDLDLGVDIPGGTVDVDIDFDLRFTGVCRTAQTPPTLITTTENVKSTADVDWLTEALTFWLINFAEDYIAQNIEQSFPKLDQVFPIDYDRLSCVTPSVDDNGNVDFIPSFVPNSGGTPPTKGGTIFTLPTTGTAALQ